MGKHAYTIKIDGKTVATFRADLAEASASVDVKGAEGWVATQWQTASGSHNLIALAGKIVDADFDIDDGAEYIVHDETGRRVGIEIGDSVVNRVRAGRWARAQMLDMVHEHGLDLAQQHITTATNHAAIIDGDGDVMVGTGSGQRWLTDDELVELVEKINAGV